MLIKMVVVGYNPDVIPDLFFCHVECTQEEKSAQKHRARAEEAASENGGFGGDFICFDEDDMMQGCKFLLSAPAWNFVSTYKV